MRLINPASGEDADVPGPAHSPPDDTLEDQLPMPELHTVTPLLDSCRQLDGAPASLMERGHYPVEAACQGCGRPIRTERFYSATWDHVERFTAPAPAA